MLGAWVEVGGREAILWGGKGCEARHAKVMSGTMEKDRRLRNKARTERMRNKDAAAAKAKTKTDTNTNTEATTQEEDATLEEDDQDEDRPTTSASAVSFYGDAYGQSRSPEEPTSFPSLPAAGGGGQVSPTQRM